MGPFGYVDEYEFDGHHLTWVMNGYGGRVQEITGKFSANRDRGVFLPRDGVSVPDLTYLRFAMEPQLMAAAVGRRVDGRQNDYTKIYPEAAEETLIQIPLNAKGDFDFDLMTRLGERFRRIEAAQEDLKAASRELRRATFPFELGEPTSTVSLGDESLFILSIGDRVLMNEHVESGVPTYSANVSRPFCHIENSNIDDFSRPSVLWGIDGKCMLNFIEKDISFATTDHCGRIQVISDDIDVEYVYWALKLTIGRYGFDRVYRASLGNMRADVSLLVPLDSSGTNFCLDRQRKIAKQIADREQSRIGALAALDQTLRTRLAVAA
jgi:hypothetical protein